MVKCDQGDRLPLLNYIIPKFSLDNAIFSVKIVNITHDSHKLLPLHRYLPTYVNVEVTFNNMLMTCYDMLMSFCKGEIFCTYSVSRG